LRIPTEHLITVRRHKEWPFSRPDIRYGFPPSVVHIIRRPIAKRFVIRNLVHPRGFARQVHGLDERVRTQRVPELPRQDPAAVVVQHRDQGVPAPVLDQQIRRVPPRIARQAVLAPQPFQDDPDLFLGRVLTPCCLANLRHHVLRTWPQRESLPVVPDQNLHIKNDLNLLFRLCVFIRRVR